MPDTPPVSIKLVADRAGVSPATVSNVLNNKASVSPVFADRVRRAVEELGYVADGAASRLRSGKHSLAGVVVPDLTNPVFSAFVSTLERAARQDGFDLLVVSCDNAADQEADRLRSIRSWRPAGLIVIPCDGAVAARLPPGAYPPVVVADRIPDDPRFDLVAVDNAAAAGAVAAHLAAQGHRSCLVAGSTLRISNVRERWEGAKAAAGPMAIQLIESGLDPAIIRQHLRARLLDGPPPEALFTLDHVTTLVAYQLLADLGVALPRDMGFASFDEAEWMRLVTPPITAVRQPMEDMAEAAWRQLMRRIEGQKGAPSLLRMTCAVEIRGSTPRRRSGPRTAAA
ncbi:LacI family DNA-binding transcriptional regulator [Lichenihabitans sp. Uapishka_5]|uniref:LacI family DNA-binding transcriptional regulator n=1 Tax=Lichenihabitans sp. Uapishka_5 TaxID=3037302 RepID=UPI0029E808E8|nr:LacI family DNA-binding transcriptional regulator [Lichenihabitans sp. Uapishka_5]MDX7952890.1 LacI family DNA-binding transcriptional regulator [Lichenihabitans sp. Uapishka_5]